MVIDESVYIIVSVIRQKRKEDNRDTGIDESIIEELIKARKESSRSWNLNTGSTCDTYRYNA
eukprot:scaffold176696_cov49-Attheya_sp.AAC.2